MAVQVCTVACCGGPNAKWLQVINFLHAGTTGVLE